MEIWMFFNLCITTTGSHNACGKEHFPIITPSLPQTGVHIWERKAFGSSWCEDDGVSAPRLRQVRTGCSPSPEESKQNIIPREESLQGETSGLEKNPQNTALIQNLEVKKGLGRGDVDLAKEKMQLIEGLCEGGPEGGQLRVSHVWE